MKRKYISPETKTYTVNHGNMMVGGSPTIHDAATSAEEQLGSERYYWED